MDKLKQTWYHVKGWFFHRRYPGYYLRIHNFIMHSLYLVAAIFCLVIFYNNIRAINKYEFLFIKIGSLLLLAAAISSLLLVFRILKNMRYCFKGLCNGYKLIIVVIFILLLFQVYKNQEKYVSQLTGEIDKVTFSFFNPLDIDYSVANNPAKNEAATTESSKESLFSKIGDYFSTETSPEASEKAIAFLNDLRSQYGKRPIRFDKRVYDLALARAKDMSEYGYLDHTNPITGACPDNMKTKFGIGPDEYVAENAYGASGASATAEGAIKSWMDSRGHRYNLMYEHTAGAVACYGGFCSFLGLNNDMFGSGCHTGEEGMQFWATVPQQPGEV